MEARQTHQLVGGGYNHHHMGLHPHVPSSVGSSCTKTFWFNQHYMCLHPNPHVPRSVCSSCARTFGTINHHHICLQYTSMFPVLSCTFCYNNRTTTCACTPNPHHPMFIDLWVRIAPEPLIQSLYYRVAVSIYF